jgi:hypothetical protein
MDYSLHHFASVVESFPQGYEDVYRGVFVGLSCAHCFLSDNNNIAKIVLI